MTEIEKKLKLKIINAILDYGDRFWAKEEAKKIVQHIEDTLANTKTPKR